MWGSQNHMFGHMVIIDRAATSKQGGQTWIEYDKNKDSKT